MIETTSITTRAAKKRASDRPARLGGSQEAAKAASALEKKKFSEALLDQGDSFVHYKLEEAKLEQAGCSGIHQSSHSDGFGPKSPGGPSISARTPSVPSKIRIYRWVQHVELCKRELC
jgi:hypothetical protein